ncbi:unnamed protein product [Caenorhabditis bovis]|uniref:RRM domain-containing protein n=1 Tax=Caenorhabditis bovis TaxID=2654633 RepID=A0A8S1EZ48_9PELO|nr:unnamed protein product [Caenorhabditis bovis]
MSDNFCDRLYVGGFAPTLNSQMVKTFSKVNFAKREPKPPDTIMRNISNVFVRGITREMTDTELYDAFGGSQNGVVQCHVADGYGFVLFDTRTNAEKKITEMNGKILKGSRISVTWARPDTLGRKRKRPDETLKMYVELNSPDMTVLPFKRPTPQIPLINPSVYSNLPLFPNYVLMNQPPIQTYPTILGTTPNDFDLLRLMF